MKQDFYEIVSNERIAPSVYRMVLSGDTSPITAPGQFVNEHYTAADPEAACAYADGRMREAAYVSLGAFGGCLVVGFDHSIENDGGYNNPGGRQFV